MKHFKDLLSKEVAEALKSLYSLEVPSVDLQITRRDFEGDLTVVVFPYVRASKKGPEQTGEELGAYLVEKCSFLSGFNVVKGFLNLSIANEEWKAYFQTMSADPNFGFVEVTDQSPAVMVEYSSPNTNKPLHLGHVRNNLLGYSVSRIIEASGKKVIKVQVINDRGIHICKSMLAWQRYGNGETPETSGLKGDKLVGKYYVKFDEVYRAEKKELVEGGMSEDDAAKQAPSMLEAQDMLRKWEAGDAEVISLWKMMNEWVYAGFNATYTKLGVGFDKNYYESETYILGKKDVEKGLEKGVFYRREDGSVWIDLTADGLDEKLVLRKDGTSVYITQDIGTATQRFEDFNIQALTYVVGNEQDYHFKVLFLILKKLGYEWADQLHHLSYGMVDLPSGKMKSREGTVVDADDLIVEMEDTARALSEELGKLDGFSEDEKTQLYTTLGLGALKYFILKVDPKKRMMFNPEESIDFNGNTGPFIQYTYARIQSLIRRGGERVKYDIIAMEMDAREREIIRAASGFPEVVQQAAEEQSPALIANFVYDLVKLFNNYYQNVGILNAETPELVSYRLDLCQLVSGIVERGMGVLGIDVPQRM